MHIFPIYPWSKFFQDYPVAFEHKVIEFFLLLCKNPVCREGSCDIGTVVMHRVALISQNHLSILNRFVCFLVVQGGSTRATPTDRGVWLDSPAEVLLLAIILEKAFKLALPLAWLDLSHHIAVCLARDLGGPSHNLHLLVVFKHPGFTENVVH